MPRIKQPQLEAFATLSGDYNPVHLDSEFAKNSYFGAQIVYGIYQVFYALNHALKSCKQPHTLESIQANFHAPLFINTPFSLKVEKHLKSSDIQAADLNQAKSQGEVSCDDFRGCVGTSKGDKAQSLSPKRVANSSKSVQETSRFIGGGEPTPTTSTPKECA